MLSQKKNDYQRDLFKTNLEGMLNHNEPLFRLAQKIDWKKFDTEFGKLYCPDNGRPAKSTRLMVGLHYLKATFNESDETVLDKWVQNVYWQHFCGYQEFQQEAPCDHSTLSRWRKRIKSKGMEKILEETIRCALSNKLLRRHHVQKVNVDTTVQEKAITYPTDGKMVNYILKLYDICQNWLREIIFVLAKVILAYLKGQPCFFRALKIESFAPAKLSTENAIFPKLV